MNTIEKVKRIMETSSLDTKLQREIVAREICQLFPKPDESRLLTKNELLNAGVSYPQINFGYLQDAIKAQDAKTASIKDTECQARVERIFKEIEKNSAIDKLPYRDGCEIIRTIPESTWQALKEQKGGLK